MEEHFKIEQRIKIVRILQTVRKYRGSEGREREREGEAEGARGGRGREREREGERKRDGYRGRERE